jgi:hypothetical protein
MPISADMTDFDADLAPSDATRREDGRRRQIRTVFSSVRRFERQRSLLLDYCKAESAADGVQKPMRMVGAEPPKHGYRRQRSAGRAILTPPCRSRTSTKSSRRMPVVSIQPLRQSGNPGSNGVGAASTPLRKALR